MVQDAPAKGPSITVGQDSRITTVGRLMRAMKIDELPQLVNVLRGEMSFVGPRPEVSKYVEMFREDYELILQMRPGITDLASIKYRHEAAILAHAADPEHEYVTRVLPEKIALAKEYLTRASLLFDLRLIVKTLLRIVH
jgi:lipopolysaccharide/colanic/teichoic acid biosynthesis glycosyltransferase